MKKKVLLLCLLGIISVSCKKTFTCDCKATLSGTSNVKYTIRDATKKNAEIECSNIEYNQDALYKSNGGTYICDLE